MGSEEADVPRILPGWAILTTPVSGGPQLSKHLHCVPALAQRVGLGHTPTPMPRACESQGDLSGSGWSSPTWQQVRADTDRKVAVRQGLGVALHTGPMPFLSHTPARAPSSSTPHPRWFPGP